VVVTAITPTDTTSPYHRVTLRVWCAACDAPLVVDGLPPQSDQLYRTVAVQEDGAVVVLSGLVQEEPSDGA
jgi:hypothetical protein